MWSTSSLGYRLDAEAKSERRRDLEVAIQMLPAQDFLHQERAVLALTSCDAKRDVVPGPCGQGVQAAELPDVESFEMQCY